MEHHETLRTAMKVDVRGVTVVKEPALAWQVVFASMPRRTLCSRLDENVSEKAQYCIATRE